MIRFHNPTARTAVAPEPYELSCDIRLKDGADLTVGLMANVFPDTEVFKRKLVEEIQKRHTNISTKLWNKGNAGVPASEEMLKEIAESCQVAIAACATEALTTGTVRDGVNIAKKGLPSIALVTDDFWAQGEFVARSVGMPTAPRIKLPHPVAGTGETRLGEVADSVADKIIDRLAYA